MCAGKSTVLKILMEKPGRFRGGYDEYSDRYKKSCEQYGYRYIPINIEAPLEVLEKRFTERIESVKQAENKKIFVTSREVFLERYQKYIDVNKQYDAVTYDSSTVSPQEIVFQIESLMSST